MRNHACLCAMATPIYALGDELEMDPGDIMSWGDVVHKSDSKWKRCSGGHGRCRGGTHSGFLWKSWVEHLGNTTINPRVNIQQKSNRCGEALLRLDDLQMVSFPHGTQLV